MDNIISGYDKLKLAGDISGLDSDPPIVLIHSATRTRAVWEEASEALVKAGRQVYNFDLRGHGDSAWSKSGDYSLDVYIGDLKSILNQTDSRPVIVATGLGGWIAMAALGEGETAAAMGLVLLESPLEGQTLPSRSQPSRVENERILWDRRCLESLDMEADCLRICKAAQNIKLPVLYLHSSEPVPDDEISVAAFVKFFSDCESIELEAERDQSDNFNALLLEFLERKIPRCPSEYRAGSDTRTLRDAMGCFATGVTIVTAMGDDGQPVGLTANSFTSVSLDPPLLLVCIDHRTGSLSVFEKAGGFAVNILHIGQQPVSNRFARRGVDKFTALSWEKGLYGAPVLHNTLASYECRWFKVYEGGDHIILLGEVERARFEAQRDPLLYFKGKYRRLHLG